MRSISKVTRRAARYLRQVRLVSAAITALSLLPGAVVCADASHVVDDAAGRCANLAAPGSIHWPDVSTRILTAQLLPKGPVTVTASAPGLPPSVDAPEHCDIMGIMQERVGANGQHYAIHFQLRLPTDWSGRFLFQGGGGSNGVVGDALGLYSGAAPSALSQGFAVLSQDSGHDNKLNNDPSRGGILTFGFDEQARANYGHASLPMVTDAAKTVIRAFYDAAPRFSYFIGCSKGGEEGMALAQRYPEEFDGIVANAPGMSLPRAGLAEAWDTQALAELVTTPAAPIPTLERFSSGFSDADLHLVRDAVLDACDERDGLKDGIVGNFAACTTTAVAPKLRALQCAAAKADGCLTSAQVGAITKVMDGVHDRKGTSLYSNWPWDTGIGAPGWRIWKLGNASRPPPSLNVILGGASLSSDFTTPPKPLDPSPQSLLTFLMKFDFDRDAPAIYATNQEFVRSAWTDISARSTDLSAFRHRGGRLIVVQGVSDPVFSINDTLAWWREVDQKNSGAADVFSRVFPVPGMTHCGGGEATDRFDVLPALMQWVESHRAPSFIEAHAGPGSPWPDRRRPLCPYPKIAKYRGGDVNKTESFSCAI